MSRGDVLKPDLLSEIIVFGSGILIVLVLAFLIVMSFATSK